MAKIYNKYKLNNEKKFIFLMLSSLVMVQTEMQSYSLPKRIELAEIRFYPL